MKMPYPVVLITNRRLGRPMSMKNRYKLPPVDPVEKAKDDRCAKICLAILAVSAVAGAIIHLLQS